jgi:hypothetical protein
MKNDELYRKIKAIVASPYQSEIHLITELLKEKYIFDFCSVSNTIHFYQLIEAYDFQAIIADANFLSMSIDERRMPLDVLAAKSHIILICHQFESIDESILSQMGLQRVVRRPIIWTDLERCIGLLTQHEKKD